MFRFLLTIFMSSWFFLNINQSWAVEQGTACDPTNPLNGAYCVNQTCARVGSTTMDKDQQNIIACLYDVNSGRNIWKSMSSSAGQQAAVGSQECFLATTYVCINTKTGKILSLEPGNTVGNYKTLPRWVTTAIDASGWVP